MGLRVALEVMHESMKSELLECKRYMDYLLGTEKHPVAKIVIKRPDRFTFGEALTPAVIISREDSSEMHLPANLPMNNSACACENFTLEGCYGGKKDLRKSCELLPHGAEMDLVLPDEWGRLDSDPLRPALAAHEKSIFWAYSEFSKEKVKLNADIGKTMDMLSKEVTVELRGRYRSALESTSPYSVSVRTQFCCCWFFQSGSSPQNMFWLTEPFSFVLSHINFLH